MSPVRCKSLPSPIVNQDAFLPVYERINPTLSFENLKQKGNSDSESQKLVTKSHSQWVSGKLQLKVIKAIRTIQGWYRG